MKYWIFALVCFFVVALPSFSQPAQTRDSVFSGQLLNLVDITSYKTDSLTTITLSLDTASIRYSNGQWIYTIVKGTMRVNNITKEMWSKGVRHSSTNTPEFFDFEFENLAKVKEITRAIRELPKDENDADQIGAFVIPYIERYYERTYRNKQNVVKSKKSHSSR